MRNKLVATFTYWNEKGQRSGDIYEIEVSSDLDQAFYDSIVNAIRVEFENITLPYHYSLIKKDKLVGGLVIASYVDQLLYVDRTVKLGTTGSLVQINGPIGDKTVEISEQLAADVTLNRKVTDSSYKEFGIEILNYIVY